jgi:hypothetical protein
MCCMHALIPAASNAVALQVLIWIAMLLPDTSDALRAMALAQAFGAACFNCLSASSLYRAMSAGGAPTCLSASQRATGNLNQGAI